MLRHGVSSTLVAINGFKLLLCGCSGPAVKYALELGMDPQRILARGQTNLFNAAKRGDEEKVKVGRI